MAGAALSSDDTQGSGPLPVIGSSADVPAWLAARRRQSAQSGIEPSVEVTPADTSSPAPPPPPAAKRKSLKPIARSTTETLVLETDPDPETPHEPRKHWLVRWISNHTTIGVLVSLLVHTVVLSVLAFILISKVTTYDGLALWGALSDSDELGTDTVLDTSLPSDGGESPTIEITSVSDALESMGTGSPIPESIRMGIAGNGNGDGGGDSGEGVTIGVGSPRVPGYAQSKGHFSAWTDPRDPKPNQDYYIVIQLRLPSRIKKYRGSDLTGKVKGTDTYEQFIRFKSSEQFDIEEGAVEVRVYVPGGGARVRDTIHVESKVLREKQTFEIEF